MAALKAVPNKSGVPSWRVAAVTELKDNALIMLQDGGAGTIPATELAWARGRLKAGDIVYVEPMSGEGVAPGSYTLREVPQVNGAIVAIDPFTGHVLALSGGFSYGSSQFDRAMQAMRQPGSTFKPFVYATALDQGYTPVTKVLDAPFAAPQGPGLPLWTPENYEAGRISRAHHAAARRRAVAQSDDGAAGAHHRHGPHRRKRSSAWASTTSCRAIWPTRSAPR